MIGPHLRDITVRPWRKDEALVAGMIVAMALMALVGAVVVALS